MRQAIASVIPGDRGAIDVQLSISNVGDEAVKPTARMIESIERTFGIGPDMDLNDEQAHLLLTCRDFAAAVVEREAKDLWGKQAKGVTVATVAVVAFILDDEELRSRVLKMMDRRFAHSADPDTLKSAVTRLPGYRDIAFFVSDALADLRDGGWPF